MIASTQIRKPENWQDFEKLCKKLWGEIWICSDTIQRNGRAGQNQCGVDVYGLPKGEKAYYAVQCKGKDDYTNSTLTEKEVDGEIKKALAFEPTLKRLIFATTANKDVKIETYIRKKNLEHMQNGQFEIFLSSWEDIVDLLEFHKTTYDWYINNCQYKDSSDINVFFNWMDEIEINPQYIKEIISYQLKEKNRYVGLSDRNSELFSSISSPQYMSIMDVMNLKRNRDYRWCYFEVNVINIGSTVVENYKLNLNFDNDCIEDLSDCFNYNNSFCLSDAAKAQINAEKDASREVFACQKYCNVIEYKPKNTILVQDDFQTFKIGVKPQDNAKEINVKWELLSRNYKKEGVLMLKIVPSYEEKHSIITVYNKSEVQDTKVKITPKIICE